MKRGTELVTRTALKLGPQYYGDSRLKQKDVRPTKPVDFKGIATKHNVNIMLYEPKKDSGNDA